MGGGKSSTQANQQTSNVQDIDTTTTSLEDVEFGIAGVGGSVTVNSTDAGAVDRAFEFGESVLDAGLDRTLDFGADALDFANESNSRAFEFGGEAIDAVGDAYDGALDRSLDFGETSLDAAGDAFSAILEFGSKAIDAGNEAQGKALSALGTGITQVSDASRSDTTDAFRRIILYVSIAGGLAAVAFFALKRKG